MFKKKSKYLQEKIKNIKKCLQQNLMYHLRIYNLQKIYNIMFFKHDLIDYRKKRIKVIKKLNKKIIVLLTGKKKKET